MVIHFPLVNLRVFCCGLGAERVSITVALYKVVTLIVAAEEIWLCGQVLG